MTISRNLNKIPLQLTSFVLPSLAVRCSVVVARSRFLRNAERDRFALAIDLFWIDLQHRTLVDLADFVARKALDDAGVSLLHRADHEPRALRADERVEACVFAVDHPVDLRRWRTRGSAVQLESVALVGKRGSWRLNNVWHLQHVEFHRVNFDWVLSVVQPADVSSLVIELDVGDLKAVTEHGEATVVEVEVLDRSTPGRFRNGIGDAGTFEENFVAGLR